jgi:hypothetical protein
MLALVKVARKVFAMENHGDQMKFLSAALRGKCGFQKQIIMNQRSNLHANQSCFVFELNQPD